jgi:hypothetical protein
MPLLPPVIALRQLAGEREALEAQNPVSAALFAGAASRRFRSPLGPASTVPVRGARLCGDSFPDVAGLITGGKVGSPKCVRIRSITGTSSTKAMIRMDSPHLTAPMYSP